MDEWLLLQNGWIVYAALFALLLGGAIGLPIPEDIPLILAGVLAYNGKGKVEWIFLVCYGAIIVGDLIIYSIGRRFGPGLFKKKWFKTRVPPAKIRAVRKELEKRSFLSIVLARHLFYLRTLTFLTCGAVRMRFTKFLIGDAIAALVSVPLMMGIGYFAAIHYETVMHWVSRAKMWSLVLGVVAMAVAVFIFMRRRKITEPAELAGQAILHADDDPSQDA